MGAVDEPLPTEDIVAGKYRIERVLGMGAMGVVAAARHIELDELMAIKFMRPSAPAGLQSPERFLREARAAVRLKSQHVARVHDLGRLASGTPYMVMEYLEGMDLKQHLSEHGPLPVDDAVLYIIQACEALAEAHAAGIVHRDLKPSNLFLTRAAGGAPCIKVLDFGIAKLTLGIGEDITESSVSLGTPSYMSPEQLRSARSVDARSDIWSLGVVLYVMLTGRRPFKGEGYSGICASVTADRACPPSQLRPDLPRGLEAVVMRCLEKSPARRYQGAAELAEALAPFLPRHPPSIEVAVSLRAFDGLCGTIDDPFRPQAPSSSPVIELERKPLDVLTPGASDSPTCSDTQRSPGIVDPKEALVTDHQQAHAVLAATSPVPEVGEATVQSMGSWVRTAEPARGKLSVRVMHGSFLAAIAFATALLGFNAARQQPGQAPEPSTQRIAQPVAQAAPAPAPAPAYARAPSAAPSRKVERASGRDRLGGPPAP